LYRRIWRISTAGVELLGGKISGKIVHNLFTCNNNSFLDIGEYQVELLGGKIRGKIVHNLFTCNSGSFLDIRAFVLPSS
jgi:hypothetical protein